LDITSSKDVLSAVNSLVEDMGIDSLVLVSLLLSLKGLVSDVAVESAEGVAGVLSLLDLSLNGVLPVLFV
jgi:hypothetical protein